MMYMLPYSHKSASDLMDLFNDFERDLFSHPVSALPTDILDGGDHYLLRSELPGIPKEDIEICVKGNILTISATLDSDTSEEDSARYLRRERRRGTLSRSFKLEGIQEDAISASCDNGVLELKLPKHQPLIPQSRRIAIN